MLDESISKLKEHRNPERKEVKQMDEKWCREHCANFKLKEPPFPGRLRTADLHKGMLVEEQDGSRMVILAEPSTKTVRVLRFGGGRYGYAYEGEEYLAGMGCQPYENGGWHKSHWLREVE